MKTQERKPGVNCQLSIVKSWRAGFSLVEIMLGVGVLALIVTAIAGAFSFAEQSIFLAGARSRAIDIAEEGLEAARNMRDEAWTNLSAGNNGVATTSNQYGFSGTSDTVLGVFTRVVNVAQPDNVRRNITSTVTWTLRDAQTASVALMTRLADWRRKTAGGAPSLCATFDLTFANSGHNTADAISITSYGSYVYLGRATNPGSEFFVFDVSTPTAPVLTGQLALNGAPNDMVASGNYVYIASTDNSEELQVIDVSSSTAPFLAASFDLTAANSGSANADALSIALAGTDLYMSRTNAGKELIIFTVAVPTAPLILGTLDLNGNPRDIAHDGNYVYVASDDNTSELQVIDVSVVGAPLQVGTFDLVSGDTTVNGKSIAANASMVYLGRDGSPGAPEFYTIDVATPSAPSLLGTLDLGTLTVNSIALATATQFAFIVNTAPSNNDYKAIDVSAPATPTQVANLALLNVPYAITYAPSVPSCNVFIGSGEDSEEFEVVAP